MISQYKLIHNLNKLHTTDETKWKELFQELFLQNPAAGNDDLLFLVEASRKAAFVTRNTGKEYTFTRDLHWKDSVMLNFIAQLEYELCVTINHKSGCRVRTIQEIKKPVFAAPTKQGNGSVYEGAFPLIYFLIEDHFDAILAPGDHYCISIKSKSCSNVVIF